ncbi:MAG: hypothetical protein HZB39_06495 [Planctomycetes bacterium]|nr:hypothetical protein [Planctomycetota bacterium]
MLLGLLPLVGACRSVERDALFQSDEAALFAVADRILRGQLQVVKSYPDIANIKIGGVSVYVGGDGLEVPRDMEEQLRRLQGLDVMAGVHDARFPFGPVQVVMCLNWKLALSEPPKYSEIVARREALLADEGWRGRACDLETGLWEGFLAKVMTPHDESGNVLLARFLESASPRDIARDVTGWWARTIGQDMPKWPDREVHVSGDRSPVKTVRDVAKIVLEVTLRLRDTFLSRWGRRDPEQARWIWILTEMRT